MEHSDSMSDGSRKRSFHPIVVIEDFPRMKSDHDISSVRRKCVASRSCFHSYFLT